MVKQNIDINNADKYTVIDHVVLYETSTVTESRGMSYGLSDSNVRMYRGHSTHNQVMKKIGEGTITLDGDKSYFIGGGEQRTIDRNKIINISYFSDCSGFQVAVSNRKKVMKFELKGRTIEDGRNVVIAIREGYKIAPLTKITSKPGFNFSFSIKKFLKYGGMFLIFVFLFFFLIFRFLRLGLILWFILLIAYIYYEVKYKK